MSQDELSEFGKTRRLLTFGGLTLAFDKMIFVPAQARQPSITFQPDANVNIGGRAVPVDLAWLSPDGRITAGFMASLDQFHGKPLSPGWKYIYAPYLGANNERLFSTDARLVNLIRRHITGHGISEADIDGAAALAENVWQKRPDLRTNEL